MAIHAEKIQNFPPFKFFFNDSALKPKLTYVFVNRILDTTGPLPHIFTYYFQIRQKFL